MTDAVLTTCTYWMTDPGVRGPQLGPNALESAGLHLLGSVLWMVMRWPLCLVGPQEMVQYVGLWRVPNNCWYTVHVELHGWWTERLVIEYVTWGFVGKYSAGSRWAIHLRRWFWGMGLQAGANTTNGIWAEQLGGQMCQVLTCWYVLNRVVEREASRPHTL